MVYLRNTLAYHEMNVANYYMGRKAYLAALNRAKFVVEKYDKTPAVPEALQLMKLAYDKLKMPILAKDTQRVFALNFPNGVPKKDLKNTIWEYMELDK